MYIRGDRVRSRLTRCGAELAAVVVERYRSGETAPALAREYGLKRIGRVLGTRT